MDLGDILVSENRTWIGNKIGKVVSAWRREK